MSKKIIIGLAFGTLVGLAIPVLMKYRKDEEQDFDYDDDIDYGSEEDVDPDELNHFLLAARKKASDLVREAESRSNTILDEAAKILAKAKEETSKIHYDIKDAASEEISKIKEDIEKSVDEFKKKLGESGEEK